MSNSFETKQTELLEQSALAEVRTEHAKYFEHIEKHPRLLVGMEVPSLTGEGTEVLRDSADARDWQEGVKSILVSEVQARTEAKKDEVRDVFDTVHASIDLFRNNPDLIPGTKQFDPEFAEQAVAMLKDYELRANEKLIGYSVPVQPILNQLREQLTKSRAAADSPGPTAAAAPSAQQQRAADQPRTERGQWAPQAGVPSKAGNSADIDDTASGLYDSFFRQNGFTF